MLTFQVERLSDVRAEAEPLLLRHWDEIALNKDKVPLDPDWAMYERLESMGMVSLTTARDDGRLVGYYCNLIAGDPHYRSLKTAECDVYWVANEYRGAGVGARLIRASEANGIAMGANKFRTRVKLDHDHGRLFEALGYKPIERVYSKLVT